MVKELLRVRWRGRAARGQAATPAASAWRPEAGRARLLLDEADRLAAQGKFAEAAHHLLLHSIQDLEDHRPRTIKPALTSRDIAAMDLLPPKARQAFDGIARVVERSLFGGRAVDADDFAECRRAYESFAFGGAWS